MGALLRGLVLGFSIAAPVGPIGVLCIRRSISFGRIHGLVTGLGAATADACWGAVAAFGLTAISESLIRHAFALHVGGGAFLVALGARAFTARPGSQPTERARLGLAAEYGSTVLLTLANPTTVFSFAAAYVALGLATATGKAALFVAGVFLGSAAWWVILSWVAARLRARLPEARLRLVNRASGLVIAAFGAAAIVTAF